MPTYDATERFRREFDRLTPDQQDAFIEMVGRFIISLRERRFDPRLRVKRVQGYSGIWEVTWAHDGRATFQYGSGVRPGDPHIIWRRVGSHAIVREP